MYEDLFWILLKASVFGGLINTIIFYSAGIIIGVILYKKNKRLFKKLKKYI